MPKYVQYCVKLTDLGLRANSRNDMTATFSGSPLHMAPEVSGGQYDPKADLWSIGIIVRSHADAVPREQRQRPASC